MLIGSLGFLWILKFDRDITLVWFDDTQFKTALNGLITSTSIIHTSACN